MQTSVSRRDFIAAMGGAAAGSGLVLGTRATRSAASTDHHPGDLPDTLCCGGEYVHEDGWILTSGDQITLDARAATK
jgi:hypothetical protein